MASAPTTGTRTFFRIAYCIPEKDQPNDWQELNGEHDTDNEVNKKLQRYRIDCPGRKWTIIKITQKREIIYRSDE